MNNSTTPSPARPFGFRLATAWIAIALAPSAVGQIAYGVNSDGLLFRFDLDAPSSVTEVGDIGFIPEGIDFRPGTSTLYAVEVGPVTTQLYTINLNTAFPTPVGSGFPTTGVGYSLAASVAPQTFGFDFNPSTLQGDNSMRIRLVSSGGSNMRINSGTGGLAAVDSLLNPGSPQVDAVAYDNNVPNAATLTTSLYGLEVSGGAEDFLVIQNPPNAGTLSNVGPIGVTVDALLGASMDIYTDPTTAPAPGSNSGFAVLMRGDGALSGNYGLYDVNLVTGQISNGTLVGPQLNPYDFTGGFAVMPAVPEANPLLATVALLGSAFGFACWRRCLVSKRTISPI